MVDQVESKEIPRQPKNDDNRTVISIPKIPLHTLLMAIVALLLVTIGFGLGSHYQQHNERASGMFSVATNRPGMYGGRMGMHRYAGGYGSVSSVSSSSIAIKNTTTNLTTTYSVTSNTVIDNNGTTGTISDVKVGDTVLVRTSSSAPTTAASITINPVMPTASQYNEYNQ